MLWAVFSHVLRNAKVMTGHHQHREKDAFRLLQLAAEHSVRGANPVGDADDIEFEDAEGVGPSARRYCSRKLLYVKQILDANNNRWPADRGHWLLKKALGLVSFGEGERSDIEQQKVVNFSCPCQR